MSNTLKWRRKFHSWAVIKYYVCILLKKSIKVEEYLYNISSSCPNLAAQVLNKILSQPFFVKEVGQYLNIYKEYLKLDKEHMLLKKQIYDTLKKEAEILKNKNIKLKKECHLLKDKILFFKLKKLA